MKTINYFLILIAIIAFGACSPKEMTIKGVVKNYSFKNRKVSNSKSTIEILPGKEVRLYEIADGETKLLGIQELGQDSTFKFTLPQGKSGFYAFGATDNPKQTFGKIYVKQGGQANLLINKNTVDKSTYPEPELQVLYNQWVKFQTESYLNLHSSRPDEIAMNVTRYALDVNKFIEELASSDENFNTLLKLIAKIDYQNTLIRILSFAPQESFLVLKELPYYKELYNETMSSADLLQIPEGLLLVKSFPSFKAKIYGKRKRDFLKYSLGCFNNDTLKGHCLADYIVSREVLGRSFVNIKQEYGNFLVTRKQQALVAQYEKGIMKFAEGQIAIDFTAIDIKGKAYSLSDFKGKIVLVDVWATWCSPCRAEISYLERLEELYHKYDDLVFVSLSVDDNIKTWEKFVKRKAMKGIQLNISGDAKDKLENAYEISGVPRFMLFDKEGKIVDIDAPRPSNAKLKEMIDEQLARTDI